MKRLPVSGMLAFGILLGCSLERYEGGFETSDLQAMVVRPDGTPVAAARVWLVSSQGDSAPAKALDSAHTDSVGLARFTIAANIDRSLLGLDASHDDSLGIAPLGFARSNTATVRLGETKIVQVVLDSLESGNGRSAPTLHIPGSHFASSRSGNGRIATLSVPVGTWRISKVDSAGRVELDTLVVSKDTTLPYIAPLRTDTQIAPDIALDSFLVDGVAVFSDTALPPPWQWQKLTRTELSYEFLPSLVTEDTTYSGFTSRPKVGAEGLDSSVQQGAAGVISDLLPDSGAIAIQFRFSTEKPDMDTSMVRKLSIVDGSNTGATAKLDYATCNFSASANLLRNKDGTLSSSAAPATYPGALASPTIYFVWNSHWLSMYSQEGLLGTVKLSKPLSGPRLEFAVYDEIPGHTSKIQIVKTKLYRPK